MKSPTKAKTFVERLEASGVGTALLAEEEEKSLARRRELVAERERLTAECEAGAPAFWEAIHADEVGVRESEEALKAARIRLGDAVVAQMGFSQRYQRLLDAIEKELREGASPLLAEFLAVLRNMFDYIGNTDLGLQPDFPKGIKAGVPLPEDLVLIQTAVTGRDDRLAKISAAIEQVQGMFLEAVSEAELRARLDVLRRVVGVVGK